MFEMFVGLEHGKGRDVNGRRKSYKVGDARYSSRVLVNGVLTATVVKWYCLPRSVLQREMRRSKDPVLVFGEVTGIEDIESL